MGPVTVEDAHDGFLNAKRELLHCKYWNTDLKRRKHPRALVFISHGLAEHCDWYDNVAQPLAQQGVMVFGHDHVGHGMSEGDRCHITDAMDFARDVAQHIEKVKAEHERVPVFIIGHSMGGMIALLTALEFPKLIDGLVLIGPLITTDPRLSYAVVRMVISVIAWLCPQVHLGPVDAKVISRDQEVVKQYTEDPLIYHGGIKAGMTSAIVTALSKLRGRLHEVSCPLLTIHGSEDKLCGVDGAQMLHDQSCSSDKTLSVYEGAYHQVHHELEDDREKCVQEITKWILARV